MEIPPEKWETVKTLFAAAVDLPVERAEKHLALAFLRLECADSALREEVGKLLVEYEQAGSTLSHAPFGSPTPPRRLSPRLESGQVLADRFRILRFVAAGGMGEVYEAEDLELRECIAIKAIRPKALERPDAVRSEDHGQLLPARALVRRKDAGACLLLFTPRPSRRQR